MTAAAWVRPGAVQLTAAPGMSPRLDWRRRAAAALTGTQQQPASAA